MCIFTYMYISGFETGKHVCFFFATDPDRCQSYIILRGMNTSNAKGWCPFLASYVGVPLARAYESWPDMR